LAVPRLIRPPTLALALLLGLALGLPGPLNAQRLGEMEPAVGRLLVANKRMRDPRFFHSVILLVKFDAEKGALGVIVNQPSRVKLAELLPEAEELKDRDDPVFNGGPVARDGMMILLRSDTEPEGAERIFGDIYVSPSREVLDRLVAAGDRSFRTYIGYAGWAPGQLESELERKDWHVLRGDPEMVFAEETDSVWDKLIKQTEMLFAGLRQPDANGLFGAGDLAVRFDAVQPLVQPALEPAPFSGRSRRSALLSH